MPLFGFSTTKRTAFRDSTQEFSNVYHYFQTGPAPNDAELEARLQEIVAIERDLHSTVVNFVRGRVWEAGGTPAQNQMRVQINLTGTGNQATIAGLDKERAVLMQWPAGVDIRGKPVTLKKWFHSCGRCNGASFTTQEMENLVALTSATRTTIATRANDLRIIGALDEYILRAESGREHTGAGTLNPYLEHHQLGDQWRAQ
jgi:hypothetical protein